MQGLFCFYFFDLLLRLSILLLRVSQGEPHEGVICIYIYIYIYVSIYIYACIYKCFHLYTYLITKYTERRKQLSKQLWKALRRQRRQRIEENIDNLAWTGAGRNKMKQLLKKQSGGQRISQIRDKDGELQHDPCDIAEVFAQFYQDLYKEIGGRNDTSVQRPAEATPVTSEEE